MKVDNSKDWKTKNLSQIAELIRDIFLPDNKYSFPYLGLEHINQQTLTINSIGNSSEIISQKYVFKKGDILFGKLRPYFRKVFKPNFDGICSTDIFVLRAKKDIIQSYLFYIIANSDFIEFASLGSIGTKMPRADWNHVKNYRCQIPDIPIQKKISEILSSLDKKIELNNKINNSLEQISQTIFKHWFIDFEFPNEQGKPYKSSGGEFVNSELGKIPKGWKAGKFIDLIKEKTDKVRKINEYLKVFSVINSGNIVLSDDFFTKRVYSKDISNYKIVNPKEFAFNPARINIGSIGMNEFTFSGAISPVYVVFRTVDNYEYFFQIILKLTRVKNIIKQLCSGTVRQTITYKDFSSIGIIIPSIEIIEKFNDIYLGLKKLVDFNNLQNQILMKIRDTLLPKLITGKIRVNLEDIKES